MPGPIYIECNDTRHAAFGVLAGDSVLELSHSKLRRFTNFVAKLEYLRGPRGAVAAHQNDPLIQGERTFSCCTIGLLSFLGAP